MAIVDETVTLTESTVQRVQDELRLRELDGWLLYNFHGLNPIASGMLGLPAMTRRYLVLIPANGTPIALTHAIEQQPWSTWSGENRIYKSWSDLASEVERLVGGAGRLAMEYSEGDAVPYVDLVPAGVVEMVRGAGAEVVTSADMVSAFYARWSREGEASHHRAARVVQETARAAFDLIGERIREGDRPSEWEIREWIRQRMASDGLAVGVDTIVAVNANAANPHYAPTSAKSSMINEGDLVLIDLWGKESEGAIYADQTWMGYVGTEIPERIRTIWEAARDARLAAVDLVRSRWAAGEPVTGCEVDDAARDVITERGYGEHFIHRTGHSIDRELHGSGPNIDNLETRDTRELIQGIGFSVEPGIYLAGDIGFRTEVDVFMGPNGPVVTTPDPQHEVYAILAARTG
ncbi:MAG TPA: Xaa-Pro peptidase family protein [Longimicrobiaceae bacterium]|nr:Xaa-Pro peptidase family protein [Longimicrobiaceae bacterium]